MKKDGSDDKKQPRKRGKQGLEIRQAFVACPRCSFFLTGYDLLHKDLEEAITNVNGKWLELAWDVDTRNLLHKSYGVNLRHDDSHYEGICVDCRRTFIVDEPAEEDSKTSFRIKISPSR